MTSDTSSVSSSSPLPTALDAAGLLPPAFGFDAIGYACTSGATLIGAERVAAAVGIAHPGVSCTDPITAALAAFRTLDVRSIGLLTPYNAEELANWLRLRSLPLPDYSAHKRTTSRLRQRLRETMVVDLGKMYQFFFLIQ